MQRGLDDNVEPNRNDKGPDLDDRGRSDDASDRGIDLEDEGDPLRVARDAGDGLIHKDRSGGLTQTDDIVDDDSDEHDDAPDVLEPIPSGEAG